MTLTNYFSSRKVVHIPGLKNAINEMQQGLMAEDEAQTCSQEGPPSTVRRTFLVEKTSSLPVAVVKGKGSARRLVIKKSTTQAAPVASGSNASRGSNVVSVRIAIPATSLKLRP